MPVKLLLLMLLLLTVTSTAATTTTRTTATLLLLPLLLPTTTHATITFTTTSAAFVYINVGGQSSESQAAMERKERLRKLALETIDITKDPYIIRNNLGTFECKLCLTVHPNEGMIV